MKLLAKRGVGQDLRCTLLGEGAAQLTCGRNEAGAGQMQPHEFHQHLIGIGRAIEGTGAGSVIAGHFCGHQLVSVAKSVRKAFAHFGFLVVANARWHGAGWQKDGRQMPKGGSCDHQARNDFITNAQGK